MSVVPLTSEGLEGAEIAWFSALCSDDYRFLGVPEGDLRSSWSHCRDILLEAEAQGFGNILCPSSYQVGQDTLSFVAGCAPLTSRINMLAAVRCGEMQPIMLARTIATLDHMLEGRLTINIISSDFPGEKADSALRYQRSREVVEILRMAWAQDEITYHGEVYQFDKVWTDPAKPYQQNGGPLMYFGGYSPAALELCGQHCDVYLMWPEPKDQLAERMRAVHAVAERYGLLKVKTIGDSYFCAAGCTVTAEAHVNLLYATLFCWDCIDVRATLTLSTSNIQSFGRIDINCAML